jgi:hypothetical protein
MTHYHEGGPIGCNLTSPTIIFDETEACCDVYIRSEFGQVAAWEYTNCSDTTQALTEPLPDPTPFSATLPVPAPSPYPTPSPSQLTRTHPLHLSAT